MTGILSCPLCRRDVPVTAHGPGHFRCEPCELTFRLPAVRVKEAMERATAEADSRVRDAMTRVAGGGDD